MVGFSTGKDKLGPKSYMLLGGYGVSYTIENLYSFFINIL